MSPAHHSPPGRIFVITGPSGVGKGTLCKLLLARDPGLLLSVSATSRPPRPGERDGVEYHFYSPEAFAAMTERERQEPDPSRHELLEWAKYNGHYYGTPRRAVQTALDAGRNVILEIETQGALTVKARFPQAFLIFIAPPDLAVLEQRLRGRATDSEESIRNRLAIARQELALQDRFDTVLINDELEGCLTRLQFVIHEKTARNRQTS
jgi:guanylate kinase